MVTEYDKLVRDEIPAIIERNGERPVVRVADDAEYGRRLLEKLDEEVAEYRESGDPEELADILEVLHAIRKHEGISAERLDRLRREKAAERGRFEARIVLERVED
ncbi:nucleoside triphosphate pyrophosphohydrolase [Halovivax sp.]|uniref:nucleoside triphosphate pyrophosphohydrolase n=1 Tax=Halovivax sp. TaxID=1935978 RepID=UPI0025BFA9C9|nr:nucleoside triphosphate pyrophosphohydrolase [Halovivax sp.]